jgi:cobalt/nickel transport system permease protein
VHILDGYLGPETLAVGWAACLPVWYQANKKAKDVLSEPKAVPVLAASAAFSFLVMMLNIPVIGGTTAHAVGAVLVAVLLGPWVASLAVTAALVIQALLFGDGGLLSLGINCLNMAVVMPFVGYGVYQIVAGNAALRSPRRLAAAGLGAYIAIIAAAFLVGVELGIQPLLHTVNGQAQYAPYGLRTALTAMLASHLLVAGPAEAIITVTALAFLLRTSPELLRSAQPVGLRTRWLYGVILALVAAVPLGLLAGGGAWGEWSGAQIESRIGYVPHGVAHLGELWRGVLPGYARPGATGAWAVAFSVLSAIIGVVVLAVVVWLFVRIRRRGQEKRARAA